MKRCIIAIMAILLSMTAIASAATVQYAELSIEPDDQPIDIGATGEYEVTLNTDGTGQSALQWATESPVILARINGVGSFAQFGTYTFTSSGGIQLFTLEAQPQSGAVIGDRYDITVTYLNSAGTARAMVTGTVIPIPETGTIAMMSVGLLGLLGLANRRRQ